MNLLKACMKKIRIACDQRVAHCGAALLLIMAPLQYSSAEVAQSPLFLGGGSGVPGNLVLTPSVEYPTIQSLANLGNYSPSTKFEGYFDPGKCYRYSYAGDNHQNNHFYPSSTTSSRTCSGSGEWSGNFLNWALTQTIDPFRKVLTGGYRVRDTATETWLEKARHPGQSGLTVKDLNDGALVAGATPFNVDRIRVKIEGLEKDMRFSLNNRSVDASQEWYDPSESIRTQDNNSYRAAVRVKVCDTSVGLEDNCRQYSQGWKPEGLIQQNARDIRYSVFGYLNDPGSSRDGGVLRANQKYVGPQRFVEGEGFLANPNAEWDEETGVLVDNPNPDDAESTPGSITNSGVINYINKFGQLNSYDQKALDPVSELYYAATRYLKNQGNVPSYSALSGSDVARYTDNFPVITDWDDPIQYECQSNVILGIGDVNTHDDGNLPGTSYRGDEPSLPDEVSDDDTVDVTTATNKVGDLQGINNLGENQFTGRENTAYIAGLAYDNHTVDMRPDLPGKQTASTHWVDVLENQALASPSNNQYYLAAKYGGFDIPEDEEEEAADFDPYTRTEPLPEGWWHTNNETVSVGGTSFKRPDNFYTAGEAGKMIESLREAFRNITAEMSSSASSVAANSTSLQSDTAIFQASFDSSAWSGNLSAFELSAGGVISVAPIWSAAEKLDDMSDVEIGNRNILTAAPLADVGDIMLTSTGQGFEWADLAEDQRDALRMTESGTMSEVSMGQNRLDYLRGLRTQEQTDTNQTLPFRQRDSRLGDIVNSSPQYVHQENFGYYFLDSVPGFGDVDSYADFRDSDVYQDRPPLILVGANDGMLHGFNGSIDPDDGGEELFAYVPAGIFDNLWELTEPEYEHRYYVDGTPRVSDAWLGNTLGWRTIAVGTTGAGGRTVFALDVTDPENMGESEVLWEFSHPDAGYMMQQPSIFALPNGEFGVAVSSGYESGFDDGVVWLLEAGTGDVIETIEVPTDGADLGSPVLIDLDRDRVADRMYIGDTDGRIWRADLEGTNTNNWDDVTLLFEAAEDQSITADPVAALNEQGQVMLFFGTGSFQDIGDNVVPEDPTVDSFYGIVDRGSLVERDDLLEQEILAEGTVSGNRVRVVSKNEPSGSAYNGWFIDLLWKESNGGPGAQGERVVSKALVRSDRVIFPTLIPSEDPCAAGGRSWLMEVSLNTGGRLDYQVFDINNDGEINDEDNVEDPQCEGDCPDIPPSGTDPDIGIINTPTIVEGCVDDDECKVVSGSSGQADTIQEEGNVNWGRINWEQLR
ncbi:pilus assembly protein [Marinobacter sp. M1N3S26]|uniref:pilus assembly protein n=1 Tax=Marinobacter sp. M1N3S26 TaxID=3382299 RepID=UPI00387A93BD